MATSQLRLGLANAWVVGEAADFETAVVVNQNQPGEPIIFGQDAARIADVLQHIAGWDCVNVAPALVSRLAPLIETKMDCTVRLWRDVYHTATNPVPNFSLPQVRLLTTADWPLLESAPAGLQGPNPRRALFEMHVAGAVVDDRLVAIAQYVAQSARYGEIGVHTLPEYRRRGFATAVASLIAQVIQAQGRIPVWSCGEGNAPSLRVAQKLGFTETTRRVYIILDR